MAQLAILTHVFSFETELFLLPHVVSSCVADFVHDVKENCLRCTGSFGAVLGGIAYISPRDIHGTICGKCNAVGQLFAPTWKMLIRMHRIEAVRCIP